MNTTMNSSYYLILKNNIVFLSRFSDYIALTTKQSIVMDFDHYKSYSAEDFIMDDNFIQLSKGHSFDGITLIQLKEKLPEKNKEISLAVQILKGLKTIKKDLPAERKVELLSKIYQYKRTQFRLTLFRYAATALLVLGLGASSIFIFKTKTEIENFASLPASHSSKSELILVDGKRIEIDSKESKIEYGSNSSTISLNDTSKLEQSEPVSEKSFNQVIVPFGKRSNILLSDGSRVWLNSGSRLVYPPVFNNKIREVFLEGEAYFEVSKSKNKPFFVRTDVFRVKVLGTRFSVQAYKSEKEYHAVLLEGKVNLAKNNKLFSVEQELSPNQKATLSDIHNDFQITNVKDAQNYIAWIYGYLNFENEDVVSLAKKISRYYNIKIEIKTSNINSKFSGKLDLKENPERILDGLATIFKLKYEKQEDKIVFYE